ncbi:MAG: Ig-like domain-containing protein [Limisphaerales bacterium]
MNPRRTPAPTSPLSLIRSLLLALLTLLPSSLRSESIGLTWSPNSEPDLAGYRLHRTSPSGVVQWVRDVGMTTLVQVDDLAPSETYRFFVTAYNTRNLESDPSNVVQFQVPDSSQVVPPLDSNTSPEPEPAPTPAPTPIPPVALAASLSAMEDTPKKISLQANASNPASLAFQIVSLPAHGTLSGSAPDLVYSPAPNYSGPDSFQFTVSDGSLASAPALVSLNVLPVNDAPVALPSSLTVDAGKSVALVLAGSDIDSSSLAFAITKAPSSGTLSGSGPNRTYTAKSTASGSDSIEFTVSDGSLTSSPARISITIRAAINQAPSALARSISLPEDTSAAPVVLSGSDPENSALTFKVTRLPAFGSLSGTPPNLSYKPQADFHGPDSIEFTVSDGSLTSAPALISLNVTPVNDAPLAQGSSLTVDAGKSVAVVLKGSDIDSSSLSFAITKGPSSGTLSGSGANRTYTANPNASGSDSIEFTVSDGSLTSSPAVVLIKINPVVSALAALPVSTTTDEDTSCVLTLAASAPEGAPISFQIVSQPANGRLSFSSPKVLYRPNYNFNGTDSFRYVVKSGTQTSAPATATIVVRPVNDAPVAQSRSWRVAEDTSFSISLGGSDGDKDPLTVAISKQPLHGTLSGTAPNFTYTPQADYSGSDIFFFTVHDGTTASPEASVSVTIAAVNDAPVARASSVSVKSNTSASFKLQASDAENDPLSFTIRSRPANGTLSGTAPNLTYLPNKDFTGTDSMTFSVSDGLRGSDTVGVTFQVTSSKLSLASTKAASPQPDVLLVAASGSASRLVDGSASLLDNDQLDPSAQVELRDAPRHGTLSLAPDGSFTYTHLGGLDLDDSFSYAALVDGVASRPVQVRVHVFQLAGLAHDGDQLVLAFPVIPGVDHHIEGALAGSSTTTWQVLGELSSPAETLAEVPSQVLADGASRFFRVTATDSNGTLVTDPVGSQRHSLQPGVRSYASPFQAPRAARATVVAVSGQTVQLRSLDAEGGSWGRLGTMATHALILPGTSRGWPILANVADRLLLDIRELDPAIALPAGTPVEIIRLPRASEILGVPGHPDAALQPGDFADFIDGNGSLSTLECRLDSFGAAQYLLRVRGIEVGPVDPSEITVLPGLPIQVQKLVATGTLGFVGRVQDGPLTAYRVGDTGIGTVSVSTRP